MKQRAPSRRAVLNRIAAGLGGGYAVAALAASGLAAMLPGSAIEAAVTAHLLAYLLLVLVALAVFVPRRGTVAWAIVLLPSAAFLLAGWLGGRG
ncbi:hypothetical protein [Sphingobium vermicomposti]|uniref:hypothetical protein n=1 Tax=Sphingobium vermicomposti TaxID=529005 RepID=UPI001423808D|nr:hypothetical protein [Sphingobium vermicomposti]